MSTDFTDWQLFNAGPFPNVTTLERVARDLSSTPGSEGFASQISILTREFDCEALTALIDRLPKEESGNGAI
jgi:hypothetical protein